MERTLIAWNLPNWITILLMAAVGYLVLGVGASLVTGQLAKSGGGGG